MLHVNFTVIVNKNNPSYKWITMTNIKHLQKGILTHGTLPLHEVLVNDYMKQSITFSTYFIQKLNKIRQAKISLQYYILRRINLEEYHILQNLLKKTNCKINKKRFELIYNENLAAKI